MTNEQKLVIEEVIELLSNHAETESDYLEMYQKLVDGDSSEIQDSFAYDHAHCIYILRKLLKENND
jgi:hypothetical protein